MSGKCALVLIANGSEETETVGVIDALRRAELEVTVASVSEQIQVKCSRGVNLVADVLLYTCHENIYDVIVLPGGMKGAEAFHASSMVVGMVKSQLENNRLVAAICASPAVVLAAHDLLGDKSATCYPAMKEKLPNYKDSEVVVDGNLITSQGPATTLAFGGAIIAKLVGEEISQKVLQAMLVK